MPLEHALLVALSEQPAAGADLGERFNKSIGLFWPATHQQIYRTLTRMTEDEWLTSTVVAQSGRPQKRVYQVTEKGRQALAEWLITPSPSAQFKSDLVVKMRGATFAERTEEIIENVRGELLHHRARLEHYRRLEQRDYPDPTVLQGHVLNQYLVLRGGIRLETFWVTWMEEYLDAHERSAVDPGEN